MFDQMFHDSGFEINVQAFLAGRFVICASQVDAVVAIERNLTRHALHDTEQAAIADGVFIRLVRQVDFELIADRGFLLDQSDTIEFRLMPTLGFGRIFVALIVVWHIRFGKLGPVRHRQAGPVVRPPNRWSGESGPGQKSSLKRSSSQ
jgi:hypothetical protein